jgi:ferredoxin
MNKNMKYDQIIIYYFSGTGNARNAAIWIEKIAKEKGLKTHLINIDRFKTVDIPELSGKTLIGFCAPTHGFNMPPIVLKFLVKFPKVKNVDAFILNTRAGMKLHKFYLPGLSGAAQLLPALILMMKGFRIVGMQPLVVNSIYKRCQGIVNNFAINMLDGKRKYKALLSLPVDLAIIPISLGYYFFGRFFLAKTLVATNACTNCNICISKCPVEAIKTVDERLFWTYKCESCMRCVNICPQRAIETAHGFSGLIVVVVYVLLVPFIISILKYYDILDIEKQSKLFEQGWSLITTSILILFGFLSYRILHFLMKYKIVNRIITYSSLSFGEGISRLIINRILLNRTPARPGQAGIPGA